MDHAAKMYDSLPFGDLVSAQNDPNHMIAAAILVLGCPVLFGLGLSLRKPFVSLCCGSGYLAAYVFGVPQVLLTFARMQAGHALIEDASWGRVPLPIPEFVGLAFILFGQILNFMTYYRLGFVGVYYGNAYGLKLPWVFDWPFGKSGISHPQYTGVVLTSLGSALASGTVLSYVACALTVLCYIIVIPMEAHFFRTIEREQKARSGAKKNKKRT